MLLTFKTKIIVKLGNFSKIDYFCLGIIWLCLNYTQKLNGYKITNKTLIKLTKKGPLVKEK